MARKFGNLLASKVVCNLFAGKNVNLFAGEGSLVTCLPSKEVVHLFAGQGSSLTCLPRNEVN